jgi:hypothetical protein
MEPVCDHHRSKVNVVVAAGWPVDYNRPNNTIAVLIRIMRVVPRGAKLCAQESVRSSLARSKRALSDAVRTIHGVRQPLPDPMPMNTCAVCGETVSHRDLQIVAPVSPDRWPRVLSIDSIYNSRETIRRQGLVLDIESIILGLVSAWPYRIVVRVDTVAIRPTGTCGRAVGASRIHWPWCRW